MFVKKGFLFPNYEKTPHLSSYYCNRKRTERHIIPHTSYLISVCLYLEKDNELNNIYMFDIHPKEDYPFLLCTLSGDYFYNKYYQKFEKLTFWYAFFDIFIKVFGKRLFFEKCDQLIKIYHHASF